MGPDAFNPGYEGYAIFPNGSRSSQGAACTVGKDMEYQVILNQDGRDLPRKYLTEMAEKARDFIEVTNLLLVSNYYSEE